MEEDSRIASVRKKRSRDHLEDNGDFVMLSSSDEASDPNSNKRRKMQSDKIVYDISSDESGEINESGNVKIKNGVIMIDQDDEEGDEHDDKEDDEACSAEEIEDDEDATNITVEDFSILRTPGLAVAAEDPSIFRTPGLDILDVASRGNTMLLAVANPIEGDSVSQTRAKPVKRSAMRVVLAKFVGIHLSDGLQAAASITSLSRYPDELFPRPHHAEATFLLAYSTEASRDLAVATTQSTSTADAKGLLYRARSMEGSRPLPATAVSSSNQAKERTNYLSGLDQHKKVVNVELKASRKLEAASRKLQAALRKSQAGQKLTKGEKKLLRENASETNQSSSNTDVDVGTTRSLTNNTTVPVEQPADTSVPVEQPVIVTEAHAVAMSHTASAQMTSPTDRVTLNPEEPVTQVQFSHQNTPQSNHDYRSASLTYAPRSTDPENPFGKFTQPPLPLPVYPILVQELDEEGQREQKRYFQLTDSDQVACLICDGRGHQEDHCPERTCRHCKAIDIHFARTCPMQRKCPRCHERGHVEEECTSKLRNTEPPPCDVCSGLHHEEDCPWRFRKMPDPALALQKTSDALLVCCHNCATSRSHLTDDCPIRDRSKELHAEWSCWSAEYAKNFATAEAWAAAGLRLPGYRGGVTAKPATKKAAAASSKLNKPSERARPEYDDFSHLDARLQHHADTYSPPPPRHALPRSDNYRPQTRGYQNNRDDDRYDDYRDRYSTDSYSRRDRYEDDYAPARGYAPPSTANYGYGPVSGSKSGSYHSVPPPQSLESRISGGRGGAGASRGGKHAQSNAKKRPIDEARERFASGGGGVGSDSSSRGGGGGGRGKARGKGRGR